MGRMKSNETKVAMARSESISMRTTIPTHIVNQLRLKVGDTLVWDLDKVGDQWIVKLEKAD